MSLESFVESSEFALEQVIPVYEKSHSSIASSPSVGSWVWPPASEERQRTTVVECDQCFDHLLGGQTQHRANCRPRTALVPRLVPHQLRRLTPLPRAPFSPNAPSRHAIHSPILDHNVLWAPIVDADPFAEFWEEGHNEHFNKCKADHQSPSSSSSFQSQSDPLQCRTPSPLPFMIPSPTPSSNSLLSLSPFNQQFLDLDQIVHELGCYECYDIRPVESPSSSAQIPFIDDLIFSVRQEIEQANKLSPAQSPAQSQSPSHISSRVESPEIVQRKRSFERSSSIEEVVEDEDEVPAKRKPISLAELSPEEVAARKREQNRVAALRYRQKLKKNKRGEEDEVDYLTSRNTFLLEEVDRLELEVRNLRCSLYKQFGIPLISNK
ncbi:unnamed protein product, partial [Mesorhabditis belari]|uniref:BZIP domain-containing protein n=1 Tax=Mesorhabditis belari TaxID=2138241 RepID=A0AAF3EFH0_9BILA